MLIQVSSFVAGLVALVFGASALVRGASKLALSFGISPLVVGLTIVAFGTSAPEMAVSTGAVLNGQTSGLATPRCATRFLIGHAELCAALDHHHVCGGADARQGATPATLTTLFSHLPCL